MTAYGRAGRLVWWLCRPSLERALLAGVAAIYLGMFIGADAVTMFCAAQVARLLGRAVVRGSVRVGPAPLTSPRNRAPLDAEHDTDAAFGIAQGYAETNQQPGSVIDPEPKLALDELIAGDPGPEPGQPGWESLEPVGDAPSTEAEEAARSAAELDGGTLWSAGAATAAGSDAAEALRMAVLETR